MINMKKISIFIIVILICNLVVRANVEIKLIAPTTVTTEENFRIQYEINTQKIDNFISPTIESPFEVLSGPYSSKYSSMQIINGKTTSTSSITYTFVLSALKEGSFTIPSAQVVVDGKKYSSNSSKIKVLKGSSTNNKNRGNRGIQSGSEPTIKESNSTNITKNDFFITATVNKTSVYQQEPIILTYKIYSRVNLQNLSGDTPDLQGFFSKELDLSKNKTYQTEKYNGDLYRTLVWRKYVLFPQESGELNIPAVKFEGIVLKRSRVVDPFESFFSGNMGMSQVKVLRKTPSIKIDVKHFKKIPENYLGGVGEIKLSTKLLSNHVKSNEALTLRVTFSGTGNLKLIKEPQIEFPASFDTYETKTNDNTTLSENGFSGEISYDYLVVPREPGKQVIPAINVSYFDSQSKTFKMLHSDPITINVAKGKQSSITAKNTLNTDIHFIHIGDVTLMSLDSHFWNSVTYWGIYVVLIVLVLLIIVLRATFFSGEQRNNALSKAKKVVRARLKNAKKLINTSHDALFYEEISKALENYVIGKLKLPGKVSMEDIMNSLEEKNIDPSVRTEFKRIIEDCDFARFAPSQFESNKKEVFNRVENLLSNLENDIK